MSFVVEDEGLVVEDDSDLDEDWDFNQCVKRLLQEEDEDEDFFFYNCKQCNYQTIWQDTFNQHMQWQHALPLKTAKRKVDTSVGGPASKKSKEPTKNNFKCDTCGHTTGYKYNLKRHMERFKHK